MVLEDHDNSINTLKEMKSIKSLTLLLAVLMLLPACSQTSNVRGQDGMGEEEYVYVTNQGNGTVSVISAETNDIVTTVDLTKFGFDVGSKPHYIAVEPDGSYWYVTLITAGRVLKMNRDNELVDQAEFEVPGLLAMDPSSSMLYVGRSMAAVNPPQRIGLIDRETMDIEEVDVFFPRPHAIAVTPDGKMVFSASLAENRIISYDVETGESSFRTLDGPVHTLVDLDISPDGHTMVAGGQMTGKFFFFNADMPDELPIIKTIDVNLQPWHPIYSADGSRIYVANKTSNTVTVIDAKAMEVMKVIEGDGLSQPHGAGLSQNGRYLYVSSNNTNKGRPARSNTGVGEYPGTVTVIDTSTLEIVKVLEIGPNSAGVGTRPSW